jgi:hypothetical protein
MFEPIKFDDDYPAIPLRPTYGQLSAELSTLREQLERMKKVLDFYGIEIFENGDTQYKPSSMKKFRRAQHNKEMDELREQLRLTNEMLAAAVEIKFANYRYVEQPCDQPPGVQCWHDEDHNLYDSALEYYVAAIREQQG